MEIELFVLFLHHQTNSNINNLKIDKMRILLRYLLKFVGYVILSVMGLLSIVLTLVMWDKKYVYILLELENYFKSKKYNE